MPQNYDDFWYMQQALNISRYAYGRTSPNPLVGAVVVRAGRIVGQGWHRMAGTPHAEINALNQAGDLAKGATIYVTLEPCSHFGRTGPCVEAIINAGLKKVVVAMTDPNPLVAGKGLAKLRANNIEVVEGILANEAAKINEVFLKWITTKMPFGVLKAAMTLDGKIATVAGHSRWITGPAARNFTHQIRDKCDAILVGIGTVLADNPSLTTRLPAGGQNPLRVIVDSLARTPLTAKVVTDGQANTLLAVAADAPPQRVAALKASGVDILVVPRADDGLDLRVLFRLLGDRQITSVLVEGGSRISAAALAANLIDKIYWFIAPKIIGGQTALTPVGGRGVNLLSEAVTLEDIEYQPVGEDILLTAYCREREGRDVYRAGGRIGENKDD